MTEIELFYKRVESEMRRKHIEYLNEQKCLPDKGATAGEETITARELNKVKKSNQGVVLWLLRRVRFIRREKYVKRYNKGINTALRVLQREYKAFAKRLQAEENQGGRRV